MKTSDVLVRRSSAAGSFGFDVVVKKRRTVTALWRERKWRQGRLQSKAALVPGNDE
jgi:hypothetical protein